MCLLCVNCDYYTEGLEKINPVGTCQLYDEKHQHWDAACISVTVGGIPRDF
jgi:hypothetical protein